MTEPDATKPPDAGQPETSHGVTPSLPLIGTVMEEPERSPARRALATVIPWLAAVVLVTVAALLVINFTREPTVEASVTRVNSVPHPREGVLVAVEIEVKVPEGTEPLVGEIRVRARVPGQKGMELVDDTAAKASEFAALRSAAPALFEGVVADPLPFETRLAPGSRSRHLIIVHLPATAEELSRRQPLEAVIGIYGRNNVVAKERNER